MCLASFEQQLVANQTTTQSKEIDPNTNIWVTNYAGGISYFESNGTPLYANGLGFVSEPIGIAIDASVNAWIANTATSGASQENSVSEFSQAAIELSPVSGYTVGGLNGPIGIAIDVSGNVWITNNAVGPNSITELSSTGAAKSGSPFTGGGLYQPVGIAIDASGNVWTTNPNHNSLSEFNPTPQTFLSGSGGFTGGGLNFPVGGAIDGAGNVWVANEGTSYDGNSISEFSSSGVAITGSTGYRGNLNGPVIVGVDLAGNVWVTSKSNSSITKFVGAAVPVVTPIVANLLSPYAAHAVNKP